MPDTISFVQVRVTLTALAEKQRASVVNFKNNTQARREEGPSEGVISCNIVDVNTALNEKGSLLSIRSNFKTVGRIQS